MMPHDQWLARIMEATQDLASREFQQEAWLPGGTLVSSPDEIYQVLVEDCTFDLFCETYGETFTHEQKEAANALKSELERHYDALPPHPDPLQVLNDPKWEVVRQSAQRSLRAFNDPPANTTE